MDRASEADFSQLFSQRKPPFSEHRVQFAASGRCALITGAGGSIGSSLARKISQVSPIRLVLLDHSQQALSRLRRELAGIEAKAKLEFVLADVRDSRRMEGLLAAEKPDFVFHAAAFKHLPLLEENPFAALENNALATWRLARSAGKLGVPRLLLISTDKAANPRSMLGVSKRLAEMAVIRWNSPRSVMSALRLGNVAGSSGSVLPIFREQILRGGPVTVTSAEATRYFLTMHETCAAIGQLASLPEAAGLYLPQMGEAFSILELAKRMIEIATASNRGAAIDVQFIGLRPGDKLHEDLLSDGEYLDAEAAPGIRAIRGEAIDVAELEKKVMLIEQIVQRRDMASLLQLLREIAPGYQPSASRPAGRALVAGSGHD